MPLEELLKFLLHLGAGGHVRPDPPLQDGLGPLVADHGGALPDEPAVGPRTVSNSRGPAASVSASPTEAKTTKLSRS